MVFYYDISEVSSQNGDLNVGELSSAMDIQKQNKAIAEAYQKYAVGQTLIFATSVNHARNIAMEIPGARVVTGETENRDEIIADFTARKIPCKAHLLFQNLFYDSQAYLTQAKRQNHHRTKFHYL